MMKQMKLQKTFLNYSKKYQNKLEESMQGGEFVFDYAHLLYYKCRNLNPNRGGSYIDSPDWMKNEKAK